MPASINGLGTTFYGQRELWRDGSFVATEWVIFLYLPLFPLGSHRLLRNPGEDIFAVIASQTGYVTRKLPLCWPQVFATYGFVYGSIAWILAVNTVAGILTDNWKKNEELAGLIVLASALIPIALYFWNRSRHRTAIDKTLLELYCSSATLPPPPPKPALDELPQLPPGTVTLHLLAGDYGLGGRMTASRLGKFRRFRETALLGSESLPENLAKAFRAVLASPETYEGERMRCFNPHHGLTVGQGDNATEFLICLECRAVCHFTGGNKHFLPLSESAVDLLSALLSEARPDLAGLTPSQRADRLVQGI